MQGSDGRCVDLVARAIHKDKVNEAGELVDVWKAEHRHVCLVLGDRARE